MQRLTDLMGITEEILVQQESSDELTEEKIVRLIDGPEAPEGVVVGVLAEAKGSSCRRTPYLCAVRAKNGSMCSCRES